MPVSTLLLLLSHVSLNDTRAVMNPKLFFDLDLNPNKVACRISDSNPTIHENVYYKCKNEGIVVLHVITVLLPTFGWYMSYNMTYRYHI